MMKQIQLLIWISFVSLFSRGEVVNGYRSYSCIDLFSFGIEENSETLDSAYYTTTQNYVVEKVYLDPTSGNSSARSVNNITYLDGFGRKRQEIQVHGSPDGRSDIVLPYRYGVQGRVEKEYLPYALVDNHGRYVTDPFTPFRWRDHGIKECRYTYTQTEYDNSPLGRVIKQIGPGMHWHEKKKGVTTSYGMNGANEVKLYRVSAIGALTFPGYYAAGTLEKVTVTDEDGKRVETFTDNGGLTVLVVQLESAGNRQETYSVHDDRGLLRHVLSPEASAQLGTTVNETILQRLAYSYDYDRWGRMIQKRLPGCDPVYLVYDKRDRLVMSQDGKQRVENANKWSYSLYDNQNRVTETGEVVVTGSVTSHGDLQSAASVTDNHVPTGTRSPLQYTLYDNYTATVKVPVLPFQAVTGYSAGYHPHVTGLVTSVRTKVLGTTPEKWLTTTTYYDDRCRVIQSASENLLGGISRVDLKHDFAGNVVQQRESHQAGSVTDVLESVNVHDDRGRLLSSVVELNGGSPATTILGYDRVGRLVTRKLGTVTDTMTYNPRGWLTGKASKAFRMQLRYEVPQGGADTCYNGNVSEWEWQQGTNAALMYGFTYDGVNRLKETVQKQKSGTAWTDLSGSYVEKGITYDRNGNIKTLQRTAGGTTVDNLVYGYTGNQLTGLTENVRNSPAGDVYSPGTIVTGAYSYDKNGNMVNDSRKVLNFSYNVLNLLGDVKTTTGALKAKYFYLADGTKLLVRDKLEEGGSSGFDYLGSLTYRRNGTGLQLESASFGDGVIRVTGSNSAQQEVNYFLTDHLGSVRVIVDGSGTVKERNDYYPFGARHVRADYSQLAVNRYKYNGKEEQITGDLKYLDYGARMYDSGLGRWFGMDPMTEAYYSQTSYNYALNNPVVVFDINGKWSVSNHHKMTMKALSTFGIGGQQANKIAYYTSIYADNPGKSVLWLNNIAHKNYPLVYRRDVDHSGTRASQDIEWDNKTPGMNNNIRHAMRSDAEAEAFEQNESWGISQKEAQLRGMKYGWDNIFASALTGHLKDFDVNDVGLQMFGVGLHALQDGYGHAGVSMRKHSLYKDVYGDMDASLKITNSVIVVHKLLSGDYTYLNQKGAFSLDLRGMSGAQKGQVFNRILNYFGIN